MGKIILDGKIVATGHGRQPAGLAGYQAKKAAQEAAALAPYSVKKDSCYSSAPWHVYNDGKAICEFFQTKKAAIDWIMNKKSENKKQEEKKMANKYEFKPATLVVNGKEFPARYEILPGRVAVAVNVKENGAEKIVNIEIPETDPHFMVAYNVADETAHQSAQEPAQEERPETVSSDETYAPQAAQEPAPQEQEPAQIERADNNKPARAAAEVPEKTFAGETITGKGWSIVFDSGLQRTRVIVNDNVREKLAPIIENAGFYYSKAQNSWNKKLSWKAYRAANALAQELRAAVA